MKISRKKARRAALAAIVASYKFRHLDIEKCINDLEKLYKKELRTNSNHSPNADVKDLSISGVKKENKQASSEGVAILRQSSDKPSLTSSGGIHNKKGGKQT